MKLIQQTYESEPYVVKVKYTGETKATYFNFKDELLNDKQTQFLSYCVTNGYEDIYDLCDYLVDNACNDYDILGVIKYTIGTDTKTHTFTNEGDIYFFDVHKAIKTVLKNETIAHITSLSVDQ